MINPPAPCCLLPAACFSLYSTKDGYSTTTTTTTTPHRTRTYPYVRNPNPKRRRRKRLSIVSRVKTIHQAADDLRSTPTPPHQQQSNNNNQKGFTTFYLIHYTSKSLKYAPLTNTRVFYFILVFIDPFFKLFLSFSFFLPPLFIVPFLSPPPLFI